MVHKIKSLFVEGSMSFASQWIYIFHYFLQELQQGRACDDLDMEQALKTDGLCTPDVIKSALDHKSEGSKISETTIDSLFGVPEKIVIPERYIPDTVSPFLDKVAVFYHFKFIKVVAVLFKVTCFLFF